MSRSDCKVSTPASLRHVCACTQRTAKMLQLTTSVLRREGLVKQIFNAGSLDCESMQREWKDWTTACLKLVKGENAFRLAGAFKGCKQLFDETCRPCDKRNGDAAKESWAQKALFSEKTTSPEVLADIQRRSRRILGTGWYKEDSSVRVPDQQGCYEMERGCGGTLSVCPSDMDKPDLDTVCQRASFVREELDTPRCRLGVAKTKGKMRVVTMQGTTMKRELRSVHESAYNRLSSRRWLVRGDVTESHFNSLQFLSPRESYYSGDFSDSTNNLYTDSVRAVVDVLAEDLPERKAKLLVSSFRDCEVEWKGEFRPVIRGSMMGNLCSFVVLCILNRVCFERALERSGYGPSAPVLINGDDILFRGTERLFKNWLLCTAEVGFEINESKTMRSQEYGDLNSQTFSYRKGRLVKKLCFGFLLSDSWKQPSGSLCGPLFDLCRQVKFSTASWLLTTYPVRRLFERADIPIQTVPRRWWSWLIKKSWFRGLVSAGERDVRATGVKRQLPYVLGPTIASTESLERNIKRFEEDTISDIVKEWIGRPSRPYEEKVRHVAHVRRRCPHRLTRTCTGWKRLWLKPVLDFLTSNFPLLFEEGDWIDEQPNLQMTWKISYGKIHHYDFRPQLLDAVPLSGLTRKVFLCM